MMSKQPLFLEQLPDDFGSKGKAFKQPKDYIRTISRPALKYASIASLVTSIATIAMAVV